MNYAVYMRKVQNTQSRTIGFQNGQDASLYTLKVQARAQSIVLPSSVTTNFSQIGGPIGNVFETAQQTCSPTNAICSSGYVGVVQARDTTRDATTSVLGYSQFCAISNDVPSSSPTSITIPCGIFLSTIYPSTVKTTCCTDDYGIVFQGQNELISTLGQQAALRKRYNLPAKLQGLRGPVVNEF